MMAASEGLSIKDLILSRTIGLDNLTKSEETAPQPKVDETEFLYHSAANMKRLKGAAATPDSENIVFETITDLKNALGI